MKQRKKNLDEENSRSSCFERSTTVSIPQFATKSRGRTMQVLILCLIALSYVESVVVECEFKNHKKYGYMCDVIDLRITSKDDRTVNVVIGDHLDDRTDSDVTVFNSTRFTVKYFPLELTSFFDNLEFVHIERANLSEVHSSDLQQFDDKLKKLWLGYNLIDILEADLFVFSPNLETISFYFNNLRFIDDGTFKGLEELFDLQLQNPCIDNYATTREDAVALIAEAELKCKNFAYLLKKYQEVTQAQFDKINQEMDAKLEEISSRCQCGSP